MSLEAESYRRKADDLLRQAGAATNMAERGRLIDEAAGWHFKALQAAGDTHEPLPALEFDEELMEPGAQTLQT